MRSQFVESEKNQKETKTQAHVYTEHIGGGQRSGVGGWVKWMKSVKIYELPVTK